MTATSIIPLLESPDSGRIQEERDFVVTGRERHTVSREGGLPYPIRAIRTDDFLYIHNFAPDRWPAGDPGGLDDLKMRSRRGRKTSGLPLSRFTAT